MSINRRYERTESDANLRCKNIGLFKNNCRFSFLVIKIKTMKGQDELDKSTCKEKKYWN